MGEGSFESLSRQQARCIAAVSEGLTTKEIAYSLGLSPRTVDEHIEKAVAKLKAPNRQRAAAIYRASTSATPPLAEVPTPSPPPYPIRGEIFPVEKSADADELNGAVMMLRDGSRAVFNGFPAPTPASAETPITDEESGQTDLLMTLAKIAVTAAAVMLLLIALPVLSGGAQKLAVAVHLANHRK